MLRPMGMGHAVCFAFSVALLVSGCTSEGSPAAGRASASPTASPSVDAPAALGRCDETALGRDDAIRLGVYGAALRHMLRHSDASRLAYLTNRPVQGRVRVTRSSQSEFSLPLLACLTSGGGGLPALTAVNGYGDSRVVKGGPGTAARLTEGRLVELSGLDPEELASRPVVFVSLNGGGGFDYVDQTVQLDEDRAGRWVVTKILNGAIA